MYNEVVRKYHRRRADFQSMSDDLSCIDTYRVICNYFGIWPIEEQISARQGTFILRYCASESDGCRAISKLK